MGPEKFKLVHKDIYFILSKAGYDISCVDISVDSVDPSGKKKTYEFPAMSESPNARGLPSIYFSGVNKMNIFQKIKSYLIRERIPMEQSSVVNLKFRKPEEEAPPPPEKTKQPIHIQLRD